jgi:hypothetical protein
VISAQVGLVELLSQTVAQSDIFHEEGSEREALGKVESIEDTRME